MVPGGASRSPRTWGWTVRGLARRPQPQRAPHARGDGPVTAADERWVETRSPRTWGGTAVLAHELSVIGALPTHVGMDRGARRGKLPRRSAPHARGDGPRCRYDSGVPDPRSPRTWGWTAARQRPGRDPRALPTHVGMDRRRAAPRERGSSAPHARGDGPLLRGGHDRVLERSPRTWGWTVRRHRPGPRAVALPTHVGMDRSPPPVSPASSRAPHARGDGPADETRTAAPA